MRNSVKATVDAYDGTVTLYAFDESDPVLQTWMKTFPGTVQPASEISPSLRAHFRYPEDLFKVQRELLTRYHVDNPGEFFGNGSFWNVPSDPTVQGARGRRARPSRRTTCSPGNPGRGGEQPSFQLTSALVFRNRQFLSAYVSASSDPDSYGKITVLQLPRGLPRPSVRSRCRPSWSAHRRSAPSWACCPAAGRARSTTATC